MSEGKRLYRKLGHVCRVCFCPIFGYVDDDGEHHVECPNCGLTKKGTKPESICACGYRLRAKGQQVSKWKNAGFKCRPNPNPTPEVPAQIIVVHEGD